MIAKVGVIYEDRTSLGFLDGLRDRLKCDAEFVDPPAAMPRAPRIPRRAARRAWEYFQKCGVDLVVRFTAADADRWQDVQRSELKVVPDQARSRWLCGVAVRNVEEWLCLDPDHLASAIDVPSEQLKDPKHRTDRIKRALARLTGSEGGKSEIVAQIVRDAPAEIFRRWLRNNDALRTFYSDCRAAAVRADCETPNELEDADGP